MWRGFILGLALVTWTSGQIKDFEEYSAQEEEAAPAESEEERPPPAEYSKHQEKIWTFAIPRDAPPLAYVNLTNQPAGFGVDLIREVCKLVNRRCKVVVMEMSECWEKKEYYLPGLPTVRVERPGEGLMNGWFDACLGWDPTPTRSLAVDFSIPFVVATTAKFWIPSSKSETFDWLDVSWQRIAFVQGLVSTPGCAAHNGVKGVPFDPPLMFNVPDQTSGIKAVQAGRVKALFSVIDVPEEHGLIPIGTFYCSDLTAILTRKDSHLLEWWDGALDDYKVQGSYQQFCDESPYKYVLGYNVICT